MELWNPIPGYEGLYEASNAGRMVVSWNDNKEAATTIVPIKSDDFSERYKSLEKSVRQQILTSFRCNPMLVGIPEENSGFSEEEYASSFRLYNRTCVKPVQRIICDAYDKVFGKQGVLTISPFSMSETESETKVN